MDSSHQSDVEFLTSPLYSFGGNSAAIVTHIDPRTSIAAPMPNMIFIMKDLSATQQYLPLHEPTPGEIALDTFTEERRGKWEKKPNHPPAKIKWGSEDFPDFTATRNMLPIPILRDAAFIRRVEIPSHARDMQNTRRCVLWAGDLHIPAFRQQPRIVRKHRIQNVLVRIFRNAIPRSEITATLKHLRLAPALQVDKTYPAATISVRGKMVKRHIPLATPVNKLESRTSHPLNRLRLVP